MTLTEQGSLAIDGADNGDVSSSSGTCVPKGAANAADSVFRLWKQCWCAVVSMLVLMVGSALSAGLLPSIPEFIVNAWVAVRDHEENMAAAMEAVQVFVVFFIAGVMSPFGDSSPLSW